MDRASECIHYAVLTKMLKAFYATLPSNDLLSSFLLEFAENRKVHARYVAYAKEYFSPPEYRSAWNNYCITALCGLFNIGIVACRNIMHEMPHWDFPDFFTRPRFYSRLFSAISCSKDTFSPISR